MLGGRFSTGALKAVGSLGLALLVLRGRDDGLPALGRRPRPLDEPLQPLDLRPGRAVKAFVLLGAGLTLGAWDAEPLWALGLFAAPVRSPGLYDLRERAMLGDTGSNLVGALAGLWLVLTLSTIGLASRRRSRWHTAYGEFRSLNALVERTPVPQAPRLDRKTACLTRPRERATSS